MWWSLVFCQGDWRQDLTTFICLTSLSWPDQLFGLNQVFLTDLFTQTSDTKWDAWCHSTSQSKWKNEIGGKSTKSQHVWKLWGEKSHTIHCLFLGGETIFGLRSPQMTQEIQFCNSLAWKSGKEQKSQRFWKSRKRSHNINCCFFFQPKTNSDECYMVV